MPQLIAILEDDPPRVAEMRDALAESLPNSQAVFFEQASEMIRWLGDHLAEVVLVSLDHDLPLRQVDGELIDFGTGRQVVNRLIAKPCTCAVIVHSSNVAAATGMLMALRDADWLTAQVIPRDDLAWIRRDWIPTVTRLLASTGT